MPTAWTPHDGGGGALFAPPFNPAGPTDLFVASDMSELFPSTDAGASWASVPFGQIQGNHETRVQYTEVPGLVYALDYSTVAGNDLVRPTRSTDGGRTWTPLAHDPTDGGAAYLFADPADHHRLLVTDYQHLYASADGGQTWTLKYTSADANAGLMVGRVFFDDDSV